MMCNPSQGRMLICSEDGYVEGNSRHPLKCDKNQQLPPVNEELFSYSRFSEYIQAKFVIQALQRKADVSHGRSVQAIDNYTDDVLQQELFEMYGRMDEASERFTLIFENYKEERLQQIRKWIDDEQKILYDGNCEPMSVLDINEDSHILAQDIEVYDIRDMFSSEEMLAFENVSTYNLAKLDPFVLPRVPLGEEDILQQYGYEKKELNRLTEFDPEIHVKRLTIPEICDMNVGEKLAERMVEIIKEHPTGITNTNFLIEFKRKAKYYPEPSDMNYSSFGDMMKDLGKHIILIQNLPRVDNFYYPMCLQGLVCTPKEMFWNIWHKVKVVLNIHRGIVKVSTALTFCQELFGWGKLDIKAWGFDSDNLLMEFLIEQWSEQDIILLPESIFKSKGSDEVMYLVLMTGARKKCLDMQVSKIQKIIPSTKTQISQQTTYNQKKLLPEANRSKSCKTYIPQHQSQSQISQYCQPKTFQKFQKTLSEPLTQSSQTKTSTTFQKELQQNSSRPKTKTYQSSLLRNYSSPQTTQTQTSLIGNYTSQPNSIEHSLFGDYMHKSSRSANPPKPKTWSSLFKK